MPDDEEARSDDDAGDPACWLDLCCPECGAMREAKRTAHLEWCSRRASPDDDAPRRAAESQDG